MELKILTYQHLFNITKQLANSSPDMDALKARIVDYNLMSVQDVSLYGLQQLQKTADAYCGTQAVTKLIAEAYVDIAYFVHTSNKHLADTFIISILRSMKLGSLQGIQLFPCILNTEDLGTTYKELFVSEVSAYI